MNQSPNMIKNLVASSSEHEFRQTLKRYRMKSPIGSVIREHWLRRISGCCVKCGRPNHQEPCVVCGTSPQPSIGLLTQLSRRAALLKKTCETCGHMFVHTVGEVLSETKKSGSFVPDRQCRRCRPKPAFSYQPLRILENVKIPTKPLSSQKSSEK